MKLLQSIAYALLVLSPLAQADELEKAKREFAAQDRVLNQVYQALKQQLPEKRFEILRDEQRLWIEYRDYQSEWQAQGKELETSVPYWEMMASVTESRADWLTAWARIGERKDWAGNYTDSFGGHLRILKKEDGYHFIVDVVRGPTFHLGHISGKLTIQGDKAIYETQVEGADGLTRIGLSPLGDGTDRLKLVGANTMYFHGARASFNGDYLWTGELTEAEKQQFAKDLSDMEGP